MKTLCLIIAISFLLIGFGSCIFASQTGQSLAVSVSMSQGMYIDIMGSNSTPEYTGELTISNLGKKPIECQSIKIVYYNPENEYGMVSSISNENKKPIQIKGKGTRKDITHTNGYTFNLLQPKDDGVILIVSLMKNKDEAICEFACALPKVMSLPQERKGKKVFKLKEVVLK